MANCRTDLPASALLRQEQAHVDSFVEDHRRQYNSVDANSMAQHDSDDDEMYRYLVVTANIV